MTPRISIVIPTLNRGIDLNNTLKDLFAQVEKSFEVIIIDQSVIKTELTQQDDRIIHSHHPEFKSASRARNLGLTKAQGPIVLFLDDDVIIKNKHYLTAIIEAFDQLTYSGVTGPIIDQKEPKLRQDRHPWSLNSNWGWLFFPRNYAHRTQINDGGAGNLAVSRVQALEVGGMDERFEKGAHREESDFNTRYTRRYGPYEYLPECGLIHIGRRTGGVRTWDSIKSKVVKAQHHYDGAFYYLFKNIKLRFWPVHLLSLGIFFFKRKELLYRWDWFIISAARSCRGIWNGYKMMRSGPKYIKH